VHPQATLGGSFTLPGGDLSLRRMGFGAMQLAGPGVWGPPRDVDAALAVLREAVALGINHIDTSDYYGPHVTNQLIRRALAPYPDDLVIVTKIGGIRGADGSWLPAFSADALTTAVHDNLRNLGQDALHVVNLRIAGPDQPIEEPLLTLVNLQQQGLVRHIGLSNVTRAQIARGVAVAEIVCVQNLYNLAHRDDDGLIDELAGKGIAYMPFLPLGGVAQFRSTALSDAAVKLGATPTQVVLAWLLQRSPNLLLIPGTSSAEHLRENVKATTVVLPEEMFAELQSISSRPE
jgi:pyridoxine 4-dehydrogenase